VGFDADLYRGTAEAYARYRLPYPPPMLSSLLSRVAGRTRLMDLACGTGQLAFALCDAFTSTWAVDQEPEMVAAVASRGVSRVRPIVASAERLIAPPGAFDLIVIGNAFHRLARERVASPAFTWLKPGGALALCWSDSPWAGNAPWQATFRSVIDAWRDRLGDRLPPGWSQARSVTPDAAVLRSAGFSPAGRSTFTLPHTWTASTLAGFTYSTSFLPRRLFGTQAGAFEAELERLLPGPLTDVSYAYDLAYKPITPGS